MGSADLWLALARAGRFAEAWAISDDELVRRRGVPCSHWPRHEQPVWDGTPLAGRRVLVRCYHGLGDTLQFVHYVPLLLEVAREVTLWAQPSLLPLLAHADAADRCRLLPLHDGTPEVDRDVDVELMELPHVFRTTLETIPRRVPYLHVEPLARPCARDVLAVGVVWRGGDWDANRNVPYTLLTRLAAVRRVRFFALQRDLAAHERRGPFTPLDARLDALSTARAMRALDLVVTVDSMPAHLAGALGVPVWTLLPEHADWRWLEDRESSPWYPTMRLFRQRGDGWEGVVDRVAAALRRLRAGAPPRGDRASVSAGGAAAPAGCPS